MSKNQRHELGTVILAVSGAVMANLALNGLSDTVRGFLWLFLISLFVLGLSCFRDDLPLKYRSRGWAKRRLAELSSELETTRPTRLLDEADIEAFDMRPGAQNYGVSSNLEYPRGQRKTERQIAALNERLKRPPLTTLLRDALSKQWKRRWL